VKKETTLLGSLERALFFFLLQYDWQSPVILSVTPFRQNISESRYAIDRKLATQFHWKRTEGHVGISVWRVSPWKLIYDLLLTSPWDNTRARAIRRAIGPLHNPCPLSLWLRKYAATFLRNLWLAECHQDLMCSSKLSATISAHLCVFNYTCTRYTECGTWLHRYADTFQNY
jgi:hypothetical protein